MIKVSVIIPAYNAEKYIESCLTSVLNQSYSNYEIIVVDDNSTDQTFSIVESLTIDNPCLNIVKNTGTGVSSARNYGISIAKGSYVVFVDSDDQISHNYIETLLTLIESNKCDCSVVQFTSDISELDKNLTKKTQIIDGEKIFNILADQTKNIKGFVWNKMYNIHKIRDNNILFNTTISSGEDLLFNFEYFRCIDRIAICDAKLYYYRLSNGSTVNRLDNPRWFELIKVYRMIIDSDISELVKGFYSYNYALIILEAIYRSKYCDNNIITYNELRKLKKVHTSCNRNYNLIQNIKLLMFKIFPKISMAYRRRSIKE